MTETLVTLLTQTSEVLTTVIAITAASLLLYNLARNLSDRVTRASGFLLGCVTITFATDSLAGLEGGAGLVETWLRLQWLGIAFIPAAMFHLSDALLATTGLVSRWRRRLVVRLLYILSTFLMIMVAFTDTLVRDLTSEPVYYMRPGPLFGLYTAYFVVSCLTSMWIVWRAWKRCLTTSTRRRMTYLLVAFVSPGLGIFPYSMLFESFGDGQEVPEILFLFSSNAANFFVIGTLLFLSYPLSFFGTDKPDRVVKSELLYFLLRGPITASALVATMVTMQNLSEGLSITNNSLLIGGTIAVLLSLQWGFTQLLPSLESRLIYTRNQREARELRKISERLLTAEDVRQLQEALLAAVCDQLRTPSAFITAITPEGAKLVQAVGDIPIDRVAEAINADLPALGNGNSDRSNGDAHVSLQPYQHWFIWQSFWLFPLRDPSATAPALLGLLGIWAPHHPQDLTSIEEQFIEGFVQRATHLLLDAHLQNTLFATLNLFASELERMHDLEGISRYGQVEKATFVDANAVHDALRDYWGGPRLSESELLRLSIVQAALDQHGGNPTRALQAVLSQAIERMRPADDTDTGNSEWTLYNILNMRFLQGKKVRDVSRHLYMSEPNFYRKQKIAVEEVTRYINAMERSQLQQRQPEAEPQQSFPPDQG
ncbi:MAG: hypothetical protein HC915_02050 [Anaerolineae bacterium]|nr:hypothetical protein [Anaerolineae bacterium]